MLLKNIKKLLPLYKNKYFILGIAGIFILFVSFLGDYHIYTIKKALNITQDGYLLIQHINFIGYLYIILSVFIFIITVLNIEQYYKNQKMKKKIYIDELSTLNNRNYLEEVLINKLNHKDYFAIMCDIDHFKKVNDKFGHDIGDKVITFVGETLKNSIRNSDDYVIRYGGEEFLILINTTTNNYNSKTIYKIFDRVHTKIKDKIFIASQEFQITMSFGINCYTKEIKTLTENIKLADIALYHAKKERNLIVIYNEENKNKFGLDYNSIFNLLNNNKFLINYKIVKDINNDSILYNTDINLYNNKIIYTLDMFYNTIFSSKELLEKWTIKSFKYLLLNNKHENIEQIFNLTSKQLLNNNIFNYFNNLYRKDLILNIKIIDKDFNIILKKLQFLNNKFQISINDMYNKEILFLLIEHKIINFLYSESKDLEYLTFLNRIAKLYDFKLILSNNLSKNNLKKLDNLNKIYII